VPQQERGRGLVGGIMCAIHNLNIFCVVCDVYISDCRLMPSEQFFRYITGRIHYFSMRCWCCLFLIHNMQWLENVDLETSWKFMLIHLHALIWPVLIHKGGYVLL
jgi:hypothetical protein